VLVYTSEPLEPTSRSIGPVEIVLYAASSRARHRLRRPPLRRHPDGRSIFLTEGIIRARYRQRREGDSTELLEPARSPSTGSGCYPGGERFARATASGST
jgi:predicted acyl esterase